MMRLQNITASDLLRSPLAGCREASGLCVLPSSGSEGKELRAAPG